MTIPETIPFSSVIVSDRERTDLTGIASLADSIADDGLILPLILDDKFNLIAGGRRHAALELLISEARLDPVLFHGETSTIGRPGFLVRGETSSLRAKILELKENLDRVDLDWRDQLRALVKAFRLAQAEAREAGIEITPTNPEGLPPEVLDAFNRDYGAMLDVGYQGVDMALKIYGAFMRDQKAFAQCNSVKSAYDVFLKEDSKYLAKMFVARGLGKISDLKTGVRPSLPQLPERVTRDDSAQRPENLEASSFVLLDPNAPAPVPAAVEIPLSSSFFLGNSLDFMEEQAPGFTNHIICDPDYAIDLRVLDSHPNNRTGIMNEGVAQRSSEASLRDLYRLFHLAYRALPESGGYFIFWYALDHHEKLQAACRNEGFVVQAHPLEWVKLDFTGRSNTAPNHQWPKSCEYAMVCRKGDARLQKVQTSSVYNMEAKSVTKLLDHAFAKPFEVWRWIYRAISIRGQRVYDPFVGSGSSAISAVMEGLLPIGHEIQEDNYNKLMLNMRAFYRKHFGDHVRFT